MDDETAGKLAAHCLEPVATEIQPDKYQRVFDRIKTQLIIVYRTGVVKDREKEMARLGIGG